MNKENVMKLFKFLLFTVLMISANIVSSQEIDDIIVKKTPIEVGKIAYGPDKKEGKIYKIYTQNGKFYVAIKYSENDYGMFEAVKIKLKDSPELQELK